MVGCGITSTTNLSIVIPTYNESKNLPTLVNKINSLDFDLNLEIIVVDDNSPDGTAEIAERLNKKYGNIKVIKREGKLGLASAIIDGIKAASNEIVAVMDADLQHPPEVLKAMYKKIDGYDLVIASRYTEGGRVKEWGLLRRMVSRGATLASHLMLPKTRSVSDPMSGYFMLRKSCLNSSLNLNPTGYKILLEILAREDYRVTEIPYIFLPRQRGESKLGFKEILNYLKLLIILFKEVELRRFAKYCTSGLTAFAVNMFLIWFLTEFFGIFYAISGIVSRLTSVQVNFLFNEFWTFHSGGNILVRCVRFNLSRALTSALSLIMLVIFTEFGIYYLLSNAVAIGIASAINYILCTSWIWREKHVLQHS